ncbi:peptide MFS transporter [Caulobacter sp. KR2-114]|uniref:peptide MFS transporter n=1 Tax=Caulobacter sp. KR2-114 TaxID=3400912 RepID=UPI003C046850
MTDRARPEFRSAASDWFGQPRGLTILFLTETWEKFSYYGMRSLLVYYMTRQLMLGQQRASMVYGLYTALAYLTPIVGGALADRWLGRRRAVIIGGSVMAVGHFMMAFPQLFYPALATIAAGNGLFLPSLPGQVGALYDAADPRRRSAYSVYYVGINLGAFLAPLACGGVGELAGWHWGFALAGVGMLAGLTIYVAGGRWLPAQPPRPVAAAVAGPRTGATDLRTSLGLMLAVGLAVVVLRGAYEQIGNTVALWTAARVDRGVGAGLAIPMTWFQALNPLLIFVLTPPLVRHWRRRAARGREPGSAVKMATGAAIMAGAYLLLAAVSQAAQGGQASWIWLALFTAVLTAGELFVLPVGLGLFARLAPAALAATAIAGWFLATFAGNLLAGALGTLFTGLGEARFFLAMAGLAGAAAVMLLALARPVARAETALAASPDPDLNPAPPPVLRQAV